MNKEFQIESIAVTPAADIHDAILEQSAMAASLKRYGLRQTRHGSKTQRAQCYRHENGWCGICSGPVYRFNEPQIYPTAEYEVSQ